MFSDRLAVLFSMILIVCFMAFCIIDVTGVYPLMSNLAIQLLLILAFGILILNIISSKNKTEVDKTPPKKNLPEPEDDTSEYRQI